ncbi:hypothetical protein BJ508DRAFT_381104 [Ascobolus immersus RN42]|uniref:Uncharacterized protein n=1 Tax=Ascobolus immersus RN42 TaxID=1160509 RepID=A0A3N4HLD5_ASCIM|nr:hypothetical protein BJ508DRAFT_381104 [Ascobolus immersus RN42]
MYYGQQSTPERSPDPTVPPRPQSLDAAAEKTVSAASNPTLGSSTDDWDWENMIDRWAPYSTPGPIYCVRTVDPVTGTVSRSFPNGIPFLEPVTCKTPDSAWWEWTMMSVDERLLSLTKEGIDAGFSGPLHEEYKHLRSVQPGRYSKLSPELVWNGVYLELEDSVTVYDQKYFDHYSLRVKVLRGIYCRNCCSPFSDSGEDDWTPRPLVKLLENCIRFHDEVYLPAYRSKYFPPHRSAKEPKKLNCDTELENYSWDNFLIMVSDATQSEDESGIKARYKAGLLRREQALAYILTVKGIMTEVETFLKDEDRVPLLSWNSRYGVYFPRDWCVSSWERDRLLCLLELQNLHDRNTALLKFLGNLRSERLELPLLKYLREKDVNVELASKIHELSSAKGGEKELLWLERKRKEEDERVRTRLVRE